jgi:hypothetical protein
MFRFFLDSQQSLVLAKKLFISNFSIMVGNILVENGRVKSKSKFNLIEENETNENEMYIEEHVERIKSGNVQIENSRVEKNGEQNKIKLQKLHVQRKIWRGHNRNSLCWAFYCVNDGKKVETISHQVMICILCYDNVVNSPNPRTKERSLD